MGPVIRKDSEPTLGQRVNRAIFYTMVLGSSFFANYMVNDSAARRAGWAIESLEFRRDLKYTLRFSEQQVALAEEVGITLNIPPSHQGEVRAYEEQIAQKRQEREMYERRIINPFHQRYN